MDVIVTGGLVDLAKQGRFDDLEGCWLDQLDRLAELGTDEFQRAAKVVADSGAPELAATMLALLLSANAELQKPESSLAVLRQLLDYTASPQSYRDELVSLQAQVYGERPGYEAYLRLSDLENSADFRGALATMDRCLAFAEGAHVLHESAWGVGRVVGASKGSGALRIDFERKRGHSMPIEGALQFLKFLPASDLRAMCFSQRDRLKEFAVSDPAELLRTAVRGLGGEADIAELKRLLIGPIVEQAAWTKLWTRARKVLVADPLVQLSAGSRPLLTLREAEEAVSFAEEMEQAIARVGDLCGAAGLSRRFTKQVAKKRTGLGTPEQLAALAERLVALLSARAPHVAADVAEAAAALGIQSDVAVIGRYLERSFEVPEVVSQLIQDHGRFLPILEQLGQAKARRDYLECFCSANPETWSRHVAAALPQASIQVAGLLAGKLASEDLETLQTVCKGLLRAAEPRVEAVAGLTSWWSSAKEAAWLKLPRVLMRLLVAGEHRRLRSGVAPALRTRVRSILSARGYRVLNEAFGTADLKEASSLYKSLLRSDLVDEEIREAAAGCVAARFPSLLAERSKPFWESDTIYVSEAGLKRHRQELDRLMNERIPEVAAAVGEAASHGDLSENAEFTSALEERDRLMQRAERMRHELDLASVLEDVTLPAGVVAPGTLVEVEDPEGQRRELTIKGPWDVDLSVGIISYTAPLAQGLLGARVDDHVKITLPGGEIEQLTICRIEAVI